jgi:hypothetical protein
MRDDGQGDGVFESWSVRDETRQAAADLTHESPVTMPDRPFSSSTTKSGSSSSPATGTLPVEHDVCRAENGTVTAPFASKKLMDLVRLAVP